MVQGAADNTVAEPADGATRGPVWVVLLLACGGEFMVVLDASVVNVALPAIRTGLGFDATSLPWVVNSYALVFAGFLLVGGRLADLYGRKRVFSAGIAVFTTASTVGGLAVTPAMLIAGRALQAVGAAVLAPASLTLLTTTFTEGTRRVRALAIWTALASAGGAAGSLLGGVLTEYLSWRSTLLINLPIGALGLLLASRVLASTAPRALRPAATPDRRFRRRLDIPGALAATVGVAALIYALTAGTRQGWGSLGFTVALLVGLLGLGGFIAWEGWICPAPLVPPHLFRLPTVALGNLTIVLAGACLMPMWYFLTLYMQQILGLSPLLTGIGFLPHTVLTVLVGAHLAPRLMRHVSGRTLIITAALLTAVGFWWQSQLTPSQGYFSAVLGPAVVLSLGGGLLNTPLTTTVTSGVSASDAGAASGLMNIAKQLGAGIGLAALVTATASSTDNPSAGASTATAGYSTAFLIMAGLMAAVAILACTLPEPARAPREAHPRVVGN